MTAVEAVFMDFGGTLAYGAPDVWEIFLRICRKHGVELTRKDVDRGRMLADRTHRSVQFQTAEGMEFFWTEWFRLILENLGIRDGLPIAQEIRRAQNRERRIYLYDEVMEVLTTLNGLGVCLGIVSNYNCLLEPTCRKLGIADFFEFILASDLLRSGKPEPLIFRVAVHEAGVGKDACLHIGDSYGADYQGALNAGLQAILLDRTGTVEGDCPKIRDLRGVVRFLQDSG